jgi:hypothetical protein
MPECRHPASAPGSPGTSRDPKHLHERIAERVNELGDDGGPQAMRRLVEAFSDAGVLDWMCAFAMACSPLHGGPGLLVHNLREIFEMYPDLTVGELFEAAAQTFAVARSDLPIGFDERLLDDDQQASPRGYKVGSLDEARARFEDVFEGIDTAAQRFGCTPAGDPDA